MVSSEYLAADIHSLCELIQTKTEIVNEESSLPNFVINECLAFMKESMLPMLSRDLMTDKELNGAFVDFIDVVAVNWDHNHLVEGRPNDPEEFLY